MVHEPQVKRVQVLKLVDDEVLDVDKVYRIQKVRLHLFDATPDDLPRKDAGIGLGPRTMKGCEICLFGRRDRRVRGDVIRGSPHAGDPECLLVSANLLPSFLAYRVDIAELFVKYVLLFPVVQDKRIGGVSTELPSCTQESKREGMQRGDANIVRIRMPMTLAIAVDSLT
jgi:hypothetical protein